MESEKAAEAFPPSYPVAVNSEASAPTDEDEKVLLMNELRQLQQRQLEIEAIMNARAFSPKKCGTDKPKKCCRRRRQGLLRNAVYNVFVSLPFALIAGFWVWLTFALSASSSIFGVGLLLLPVFALSWRALAKVELFIANMVGERWRPIPASAPFVPQASKPGFFNTVKAILADQYTVRATVYFMFFKLPIAYINFYLTVGLPWLAFKLISGAIFIYCHSQEILAGTFDPSRPLDGLPSDFDAAARSENGVPPHHGGHHGAHPSPSVAAASAASAASSLIAGTFSHMAHGFEAPHHHLQVLHWLAMHPVVVAMAFPLAIFLIVLAFKAVIHFGKWQRIIAIAALGAPSVSPTHVLLAQDDTEQSIMMTAVEEKA